MKTNYILKLAAAAALIAILPVTPSVFGDSKGKDKDNKHKQNESAQKHDSSKGKPGKHDCHYPCHYKDCKNKPPFTKPPKPPKPPYCPPPAPPVVTNCVPKPPIVVTNCPPPPVITNCPPAPPVHTNCPPVPPTATNCVTEYSGRAVIVDLTNSHLGTSIVLGDTGDLPPAGGVLEKTLGATAVDNTVFFETAHAGTMGANGVSDSAVTITNFLMRFVTQSGKEYRIAADFIQVMVTAECTASGIVTHASSIVQGLELNDIPLTVTGQANQQFLLKEGLLTVNLQSEVLSGNCAEVSAAAMHLYITNCYSGFVGVAHADICCCVTPTTPPGPCPPVPPVPPVPPQTNICGKLTGGGFIVGTPSGAKGSFAVAGGVRRGAGPRAAAGTGKERHRQDGAGQDETTERTNHDGVSSLAGVSQ